MPTPKRMVIECCCGSCLVDMKQARLQQCLVPSLTRQHYNCLSRGSQVAARKKMQCNLFTRMYQVTDCFCFLLTSSQSKWNMSPCLFFVFCNRFGNAIELWCKVLRKRSNKKDGWFEALKPDFNLDSTKEGSKFILFGVERTNTVIRCQVTSVSQAKILKLVM